MSSEKHANRKNHALVKIHEVPLEISPVTKWNGTITTQKKKKKKKSCIVYLFQQLLARYHLDSLVGYKSRTWVPLLVSVYKLICTAALVAVEDWCGLLP